MRWRLTHGRSGVNPAREGEARPVIGEKPHLEHVLVGPGADAEERFLDRVAASGKRTCRRKCPVPFARSTVDRLA